MISLGLISLTFAVINSLVTIIFAAKKEEDPIVKFAFAHGSILIFLCGISALLFEAGYNNYAILLMVSGFIIYNATAIATYNKSRHRTNQRQDI